MGSISRRPAPPGPITRLFDRLNQLHLQAGEPSLRLIAMGIGRGMISRSTVFKALSGPRVPGWSFLELIVIQLGGDPTEFQPLWSAARQAERGGATPQPQPTTMVDGHHNGDQAPEDNVVWGRVPARNPSFAARTAELQILREGLARVREGFGALQILYGNSGVGKTEVAVEHAHQHRRDYSVVWYVNAENEHAVKESLIELGRILQLHNLRDGYSDHLVALTLRALQSGSPHPRSLIIFDNAPRPESIVRYLPSSRAHVIVTTHVQGWHHLAEVREVIEFTQAETIDYLSRRVPRIATAVTELAELAVALTGLPLAVELAAAYLNETEQPVESYFARFRAQAMAMVDPDGDYHYPRALAVCLALTKEVLSSQAAALLHLLAPMSPEPVSEELLLQPLAPKWLLPELRETLRDSRHFRSTARELARFSLLRLDSVHNTVRLHRALATALTRLLARDDAETEEQYRRMVHLLLAASDPGIPDLDELQPAYDRSYPHLIHAGALTSDHAPLRTLVTNQIHRLRLRGRVSEAHNLALPAMERWRRRFGDDDLQTLAVATELGVVLYQLGEGPQALTLTQDTLERLGTHYGTRNEVYLVCARNYSTHLRLQGQYAEAQHRDQELLPLHVEVFGEGHFQTLNLLNNIAVDLRCMGRYAQALDYDHRTYEGRMRVFGPSHIQTLDSQFAVARDQRGLGRYEDSLEELQQVMRTVDRTGDPWSLLHLLYALDLSVALRRNGEYREALDQGETLLKRHRAIVGPLHQQSLTAAGNLITDRRICGDLEAARTLGEETVRDWIRVAGPRHPNTLATMANLAVAQRLSGDVEQARTANGQVLEEFTRTLGVEHPHSLVIMCNLASDHAAGGALPEAVRLGERALVHSRRVRGETHPFTLAIAANLALDLQAAGDERGWTLHTDTIGHYLRRLPSGHPEIRAVARGLRVNLDIETDHT